MSDQRTITAKRRAANQAAARKSTGPKTEEGKQRAAFNSFQHGAFATESHIREAAAKNGSSACRAWSGSTGRSMPRSACCCASNTAPAALSRRSLTAGLAVRGFCLPSKQPRT